LLNICRELRYLCFCVHTQPTKLMQSIISCAQLEDAIEEERLHLSTVEVDVEDVESFKSQLKGLHDSILIDARSKCTPT